MFNNTVDSLVSKLTKTAAKLEKLAAKKAAEREAKEAMIASLESDCDCCASEEERAYRVADKLMNLVG